MRPVAARTRTTTGSSPRCAAVSARRDICPSLPSRSKGRTRCRASKAPPVATTPPVAEDNAAATPPSPVQLEPPPLAVAPPVAASSGTPVYVWFALGVGLTIAGQKIYAFFFGGGLQKFLMQQMMKKMGGGAMPGMPGGMPGGMPNFGASPGGAVPPNPFGAAAPGGGGFGNFGATPSPAASASPAVNTTATATTATATTASPASSAKAATTTTAKLSEPAKEEKTAATAKAGEPKTEAPKSTTASTSSIFQDLDESSTTSEPTFQPKPVEEVETPPSGGPTFDPEVMAAAMGGNAAGGATGEGNSGMMDMVEQMMQDPKMQEMMYPYLPEGMRNPETFQWILSNPEMRGQMEQMLQSGMPGGMPGMNPEMANMMNMKDDDFKKQFENVGMSPEEVLKKIMEEPELAAAFQNPRVQQAMMDCSANPMNISKVSPRPRQASILLPPSLSDAN